MRDAGIPTPDFFAFNETAFKELGAARALPAIEERLAFPIVVKPAGGGSALGIKFAADADAVAPALIAAFSYDTKVLLERHIRGRDLAVSVLEAPTAPRCCRSWRRSRTAATSTTSRHATRSGRRTSGVRRS
jgi:D-alanine-D-alanine ligase